ncbi:MAG: hypothetical protein AB2A00_29850 [Myxococcota bacterium]
MSSGANPPESPSSLPATAASPAQQSVLARDRSGNVLRWTAWGFQGLAHGGQGAVFATVGYALVNTLLMATPWEWRLPFGFRVWALGGFVVGTVVNAWRVVRGRGGGLTP